MGNVVFMLTRCCRCWRTSHRPSPWYRRGNCAIAEFWLAAGFVTAELVTTLYEAFFFAHTAYTRNVSAVPPALLMSALQPVVSGTELFMLVVRLIELMTAPPPYGTVLAGQVAVPVVCVPGLAVSSALVTTVYFGGTAFGSGAAGPRCLPATMCVARCAVAGCLPAAAVAAEVTSAAAAQSPSIAIAIRAVRLIS